MTSITGSLSGEKSTMVLGKVSTFVRAAIWALPVWVAMLFLSTLTHQPDPQTEFASFAAYVTTGQFLFSHLVYSIAGAAIGSIGAIALMLYLQDTRAVGAALAGMVAAVMGNTLNSSVFGAAAFAQTALGKAHLAGEQNALEIYNLVYSAPLFGTVLVALLFFVAGGVLTGIAITSSGRFPRWIGWVYAVSIVAFVISNILMPDIQSFILALLFVLTVLVAWGAGRRS